MRSYGSNTYAGGDLKDEGHKRMDPENKRRIGEAVALILYFLVDGYEIWPASHAVALLSAVAGTSAVFFAEMPTKWWLTGSATMGVIAAAIYLAARPLQADPMKTQTERVLTDALIAFAGTPIRIKYYGDDESRNNAYRFEEIFQIARWKVEGEPQFGGITIPPTESIQPTVSQRDVEANQIPRAADALFAIFWKCGIVPINQKWMNPEVPPGIIELRVGSRPPPDLLGPNRCSH